MEARSGRKASTKGKTGGSRKSSPNGNKSASASEKRSKPKSKPALESFNPATGELIGTVETITPAKVQGVVDDVAEVQPFWAQLSLADRARYMRRAADVLVDDLDEVAELLTREQGKPRIESYTMEVVPTIDVAPLDRRQRARRSSPTSRSDAQLLPEVEEGEVHLRAASAWSA